MSSRAEDLLVHWLPAVAAVALAKPKAGLLESPVVAGAGAYDSMMSTSACGGNSKADRRGSPLYPSGPGLCLTLDRSTYSVSAASCAPLLLLLFGLYTLACSSLCQAEGKKRQTQVALSSAFSSASLAPGYLRC